MESFRQAVLSISTACVIGAVLKGTLPEKIQRLGINTVLVLYIVLTAIRWQKSFSMPDFWAAVHTGPAVSDYTDYSQQLYRAEVQQQLQAVLDTSGINAGIRLEGEVCWLSVLPEVRIRAEQLLRETGWQGEIREEPG